MFGGFFSSSVSRASVQGLNVAFATFAVYQYWVNPQACLSELSLDLACHTINFLAAHEESSPFTAIAAVAGNGARLGAIYTNIMQSNMTVSPTFLKIDTGFHLFSIAGQLMFETNDDVHELRKSPWVGLN